MYRLKYTVYIVLRMKTSLVLILKKGIIFILP